METTITDYISVRQRATDLGCAIPQEITLLPTNFASATTRTEFLQLSEAATVRTLFRNHHLTMDELLPTSERSPYIQNNSSEWLAPTLFISSLLISQNPTAVSVALSVLANYVTDYLKGIPGPKIINVDIVVEKKGDWSCKTLSYKGDPAGLNTLPDIIRQMSDE
jgi:hypothetical protein